MLYYRI